MEIVDTARTIATKKTIEFLKEVVRGQPPPLLAGIDGLSLNEISKLVPEDLDAADESNIETCTISNMGRSSLAAGTVSESPYAPSCGSHSETD